MRANSILDTIGNTPHVRIQRLFGSSHEVWIKLERANPGGSIKDRIALAMVDDAERRGVLTRETTIIEPTSGNTGIGLAMVAAVRGYRLVLVMPESMSLERRRIMRALGAELVLTPKELGMKGAIAKAEELAGSTTPSWIPQQFDNPANAAIHRNTTAQEILRDFPEGIDVLITGVGTGGHISGCGQTLKPRLPHLKIFAVEPSKSPIISGGTHTPHRIQGIGAGFIPGNLDRSVLDGTILVSEEEAVAYAQRAAREEGLFLGLSSGATLAAIAQKLTTLPPGSRVLGFCYDTGERSRSTACSRRRKRIARLSLHGRFTARGFASLFHHRGDAGGVRVENAHDFRIIGGFGDVHALLGDFDVERDLLAIVEELHEDRIPLANASAVLQPFLHRKRVIANAGGNIGIIGFGDGVDPVGKLTHGAADLLVVTDQAEPDVSVIAERAWRSSRDRRGSRDRLGCGGIARASRQGRADEGEREKSGGAHDGCVTGCHRGLRAGGASMIVESSQAQRPTETKSFLRGIFRPRHARPTSPSLRCGQAPGALRG
jgi:cysteine synthase A